MGVGILSGVISGFLCAIAIWILQSFWNVSARSVVLERMSRLRIYYEAIKNDINCGQEFPNADLFHAMTEKASFSLLYLNDAQVAVRHLNFRFHGRKHIIALMGKIESDLTDILTIWMLSNNGKDEWKSRFRELADKQQTPCWNLDCYRIEAIVALAEKRMPFSKKRARAIIDSVGLYEDYEDGYKEIRAELKKI